MNWPRVYIEELLDLCLSGQKVVLNCESRSDARSITKALYYHRGRMRRLPIQVKRNGTTLTIFHPDLLLNQEH